MALVYEKIVAEDLELGTGTVSRTSPSGGTMTGNKINLSTFGAYGLATHADNTTALAAGLIAGDLYVTSTGILMVTY
jgi:hypothetical protein